MDTPDLFRFIAGLLFLGVGIWHYRRRAGLDGSRGSQSGTLLIMVGLVLLVWVAGNLLARPTAAELRL